MMLNLLVYVPVQFIGFYMWRRHMTRDNTVNPDSAEEVVAKSLGFGQWVWVVVAEEERDGMSALQQVHRTKTAPAAAQWPGASRWAAVGARLWCAAQRRGIPQGANKGRQKSAANAANRR